MNILEIRTHLTTSFSDRVLSLQLGSLDYLQKLASVSNTNIVHWNLEPFLSDGKFPGDRNKINQIFFDQRDLQSQKAIEASKEVSGKFNDKELIFLRTEFTGGSKKTLEKNLINARSRQENLAEEMTESHRNIIRTKKILKDFLTNDGNGMELKIEQVVAQGFWEFERLVRSVNGKLYGIELETANDVIINHIVEKHGIKKQINFGKFKLFLDYKLHPRITKLGERINRFDRDISEYDFPYISAEGGRSIGGFIHPHVLGGNVCFGVLSEDASRATAANDLVSLCGIIQRILLSYNDDDSYRHILDFEAISIARASGKNIYHVDGEGAEAWINMINENKACEACEENIDSCKCFDPIKIEEEKNTLRLEGSNISISRHVDHDPSNGVLTFRYCLNEEEWRSYSFSDGYYAKFTVDDITGVAAASGKEGIFFSEFVEAFLKRFGMKVDSQGQYKPLDSSHTRSNRSSFYFEDAFQGNEAVVLEEEVAVAPGANGWTTVPLGTVAGRQTSDRTITAGTSIAFDSDIIPTEGTTLDLGQVPAPAPFNFSRTAQEISNLIEEVQNHTEDEDER